MHLNTSATLQAYDDFYAALLGAHQDLSDEQSQELNATLVLLLANHIGDMSVIQEALQDARHCVCGAITPAEQA